MTYSIHTMIERHPTLAIYIRTGSVMVFCAISFFVIAAGMIEADPVTTGNAYALEAVR